ncbi:MAG: TlpA family protein disulfide reductase [Candidatus Latescibacterota bacterium]|nr:MAG: TlpA family protein disulfide reductase [Candidatus Latescibacterota bacterium]
MKPTLLLLCALAPSIAVAESAPDFEATLLDGERVHLESFRGQVVLIEFWATWCGPCREQLPKLAALENAIEDLVVLAVNVDKRRERVELFAERVRLPQRVLLDPEARVADRYAIQGMPWAVLVAADGTIVWQGNRAGETYERVREAVRRQQESE